MTPSPSIIARMTPPNTADPNAARGPLRTCGERSGTAVSSARCRAVMFRNKRGVSGGDRASRAAGVTERRPDVVKPERIAFQGSSLPRALISAQSIVVNVMPHIANDPASRGACVRTRCERG